METCSFIDPINAQTVFLYYFKVKYRQPSNQSNAFIRPWLISSLVYKNKWNDFLLRFLLVFFFIVLWLRGCFFWFYRFKFFCSSIDIILVYKITKIIFKKFWILPEISGKQKRDLIFYYSKLVVKNCVKINLG